MTVLTLGIPTVHGKQYLYSGYYKGGKLVSKLYPIKNLLFISESIREQTEAKSKELALYRTNEVGEIRIVSNSGSISSRALRKKLTIIIPPLNLISHIAVSEKTAMHVNKKIVKEFLATDAKMMELTLFNISFNNLKRPKDISKNKNITDDEANYREWFNMHMENHAENIIGAVLPRIRAVICYVCNDILLDSEVFLIGKNKIALQGSFQKISGYDLPCAVFTGDPATLPSGQYKFTIKLSRNALLKEHIWCREIINNGEYTLTEFIRFPIRHPLYEIDVIHCDPITVEEALFTQFPDQFAHFAMAARKAMRQDKDSVETTETTASKDPSKASSNSHKGVEGLYRQLIAKKQIVEASHNMAYADYSGRKVFQLGKLIRTFVTPEVDKKLNDTAKLVFSAFDTWEKVSGMLQKSSDLVKSVKGEVAATAFKEALKKSRWGKVALLDGEISSFSNSVAAKFNLPKWGAGIFDKINKPLAFMDAGLKMKVFADGAHDWFEAAEGLNAEVNAFQSMVADYHTHTAFLSDSAEKIGSPEKIYFQSDGVSPADSSIVYLKKAAAHLKSASNHLVLIEGHTDSSGSDAYNLELSFKRGWSVKDAIAGLLSKEAAHLADRILVNGLGEAEAGDDMADESKKKENRRCDLFFAKGTFEYLPSRVGIRNLEVQRNLTVSGWMKNDKKQKEALISAFDAILSVTAVIPATAVPALFLLAAKELVLSGGALYKNAFAVADEIFFDKFYEQLDALKNILKTYTDKSVANHHLIRHENFDSATNTPIYQAVLDSHFRIRAESLSGLLNLIHRAFLSVYEESGSDESKTDEMRFEEVMDKVEKKYQVDAYIKNFVINDEWTYPLYHRNKLALDTYWLMVINTYGHDQSKKSSKGLTHGENFNVDQNALLTSAVQVKRLEAEIAASMGNHYIPLSMSITRRLSSDHITGGFSTSFPIHHIASETAKNLASTFAPVRGDLSDDCYDYMNIYYRKRDERDPKDWKPLINRKRSEYEKPWFAPLSPFDQIRVLVVLKKKCKGIFSATFQVNRYDDDAEGIKYKTIMAPLNEDELLAGEKVFAEERYVGVCFLPLLSVFGYDCLWPQTHAPWIFHLPGPALFL